MQEDKKNRNIKRAEDKKTVKQKSRRRLDRKAGSHEGMKTLRQEDNKTGTLEHRKIKNRKKGRQAVVQMGML